MLIIEMCAFMTAHSRGHADKEIERGRARARERKRKRDAPIIGHFN